VNLLENVQLGPKTTLELGGAARYFVKATDDATVVEALRWSRARGLPARVLGGGSNLVIADGDFEGLVIEMAQQGVRVEGGRVSAAAGERWDDLVALTVQRELAGLECLSGIPGRVGATPIQNVGAYGHEISHTLRMVRVLDRATLQEQTLAPDDCELSYRNSRFKREPDRFVVLEVSFELEPGGAPSIRYAELQRAVAELERPDIAAARRLVIELRRGKSMVLEPDNPNRRSAGSFFTNPFVTRELADRLIAASDERVPHWPTDDGRVKLAAGWLIERAGMRKGTRRGSVGISSAHALALIHHGGGTTSELLALAAEVRAAVLDRFGVELEREPVLWARSEEESLS